MKISVLSQLIHYYLLPLTTPFKFTHVIWTIDIIICRIHVLKIDTHSFLTQLVQWRSFGELCRQRERERWREREKSKVNYKKLGKCRYLFRIHKVINYRLKKFSLSRDIRWHSLPKLVFIMFQLILALNYLVFETNHNGSNYVNRSAI